MSKQKPVLEDFQGKRTNILFGNYSKQHSKELQHINWGYINTLIKSRLDLQKQPALCLLLQRAVAQPGGPAPGNQHTGSAASPAEEEGVCRELLCLPVNGVWMGMGGQEQGDAKNTIHQSTLLLKTEIMRFHLCIHSSSLERAFHSYSHSYME